MVVVAIPSFHSHLNSGSKFTGSTYIHYTSSTTSICVSTSIDTFMNAHLVSNLHQVCSDLEGRESVLDGKSSHVHP
jgi:hypothetical protein